MAEEDLAELFEHDKEDMKLVLDDFPNQVREAYKQDTRIEGEFKRICFCGMGGSGFVGSLFKMYLDDLDIHLVRDYKVPKYLEKNTLFILVSYSGNTEEVNSCFTDIARFSKAIVCFSSGGKLEEKAKSHRIQHIKLPKGMMPRNSVPYQFFAILKILENSGIVSSRVAEVKKMLNSIKMLSISDNALKLSERLKDKIPVVYSSSSYFPLSYRLKTQFNESSKVMAFCHELPELCHNELSGYTLLKGPFALILFRFDDDFRRTQKRMDLIKKIVKKSGVDVIEISLKGDLLSKMFSGLLIGDYLAFYLGLRYRLDPSPVKIIEKFKEDLGPYV